MAKVSNGVKTLPKISIARVGCTNVTDDRPTDRQTDGRTDGQTTTYSEREHEFTFAMFTFAKKACNVICGKYTKIWLLNKAGNKSTEIKIKFN